MNCPLNLSSSESEKQFVGMKTLFFYNIDENDLNLSLEDKLVQAFNNGYELFLTRENIFALITTLTSAVRNGLIQEEKLDRRLMKLLFIKSMNFLNS